MSVPLELVQSVNVNRPRCLFNTSARGCRKGIKCPFLHDNGPNRNELHLPHVSRYAAADGSSQLVLRPPVSLVVPMLVEDKLLTMLQRRVWTHVGLVLLAVHLVCMIPMNVAACDAARVAGCVGSAAQRHGKISSREMPPLFRTWSAHGFWYFDM